MEWTKKDLGQDTINQILPIDFKLFLKKHHKKYLKNMNEYPEVNRKCYVLINAGYFIIAKSAGIDGTTFKTAWRTNATEKDWLEFVKTSGREDLREKFYQGYDCWVSFNVLAALGWVYPEEFFSMIKSAKFHNKK